MQSSSNKILYLGTDPSRYPRLVVHCPLIQIVALPLPEHVLSQWEMFTHIILTSPNAVQIFNLPLEQKQVFAIGAGTAYALQEKGIRCAGIAYPETQEGMIELLRPLSFQNSKILYPRSSQARPLLGNYLKERGLRCEICDLYDTRYLQPDPLPNLGEFSEIIFTSPSTVKAFFALYSSAPRHLKLTCLGPVTQQALDLLLKLKVRTCSRDQAI
jgi:uroporphyrinogen-III synthase